jgi:GDP-mannose 6-dehydrogenase
LFAAPVGRSFKPESFLYEMPSTISVFGLGYVGCVSAACLAREGHTVTGVDVSATKVDTVRSGHATIVENGIDELVGQMVTAGRLSATTDVRQAVLDTQISLVCVGTPSQSNGGLDLTYVRRVATQIGEALRPCSRKRRASGRAWISACR